MAELNVRKRGKKWEYRFEGAKIDGKRNQISKGGFRTKKEALEVGTKALSEYNNAGLHFIPSEISLSDYMDYWIESYCRKNLSENTVSNYQKKIKNHIKPALGIYKLKSVPPSVLQEFIYNKFNEGYSRNTLTVIKGILSGAFSYAVEPAGFIKDNPMLMVKLPLKRAKPETPTRTKEREPIPPEQIKAILKRFPEGHSCHIPLQLAYRCGMRLGEVFALSWDDIDFENNKIDINKQVQEYEDKETKIKYWTFVPPKYDSYRIIDGDPVLMDLLQRTKDQQIKAKEYYAEHYTKLYINSNRQLNTNADGEEIQMVNTRENGTYIQPRVTQHLGRVVHYQMNYPEFEFHSLRHTHATMLINSGIPYPAVQERLGHAKIQMTIKYTHPTEDMRSKIVDLMGKI